ncbi:MAG: hypothetical protein ACOX7Y_08120 [Methanosarcina sp.]
MNALSPNPIGVINRRNGCGATVVFDQKRKPFEKRFDRKASGTGNAGKCIEELNRGDGACG